jgi:ribosomal protein S18 acetylase RimI-like enzyme
MPTHPKHPLDNVIWEALTTHQAHFAESYTLARRFPAEVTALGAFREASPDGYDSLARLLGPGGRTALFLEHPPELPAGWTLAHAAPLLQMVHENGGSSAPVQSAPQEIIELGPADVPDMMSLAALTKPGPFGPRTRELGTYLGVGCAGTLAAMAGERLSLPGYAEVSAVCTHPAHLGQGYASALISVLVQRIRQRSARPFLHVRAENQRAIAVYERLEFPPRRTFHLAVVRAG